MKFISLSFFYHSIHSSHFSSPLFLPLPFLSPLLPLSLLLRPSPFPFPSSSSLLAFTPLFSSLFDKSVERHSFIWMTLTSAPSFPLRDFASSLPHSGSEGRQDPLHPLPHDFEVPVLLSVTSKSH